METQAPWKEEASRSRWDHWRQPVPTVRVSVDCPIYFRLSISEPPLQPLNRPKKVISTQPWASSNFKSKGSTDLQMLRQGWCAELEGDMLGCHKVSEFQMGKKELSVSLGLFNLRAQWPVYKIVLVCSNTVQSGQQYSLAEARAIGRQRLSRRFEHQTLPLKLLPFYSLRS